MSGAVTIRDEAPGQDAMIAALTQKAFATVSRSDGREADIVAALRSAGALPVSLVALVDAVVLGHVALSPVRTGGGDPHWFGLGPLSVEPTRQRRGIGAALVREAIARIRDRGAHGCVVLGDPAYYRRFGFEIDDRLRYPGAPPGHFLALSFDAELIGGDVNYHPAFG